MSDDVVKLSHPWVEDVIGNIGIVTVGGTPRTSIEKYWGGDVPWMASGDIHEKRITDVPTRITELGLRHSNATMVDPPAVAIGLAGQGKTRGTVALVLSRLCTNQSVALVKTDPTVLDVEYLFYNLEFRYDELRSRSAGDGRAGLTKTLIEQVPVPLPPLPEQTKIAEILATLDRAIERTEALIAKEQRIKTGLMQDLLTRGIDEHGRIRSEQSHRFKDSALGRIPAEWGVHLLDGLAIRGSGHTPNKSRPDYWNGGIKWVSLADSSALDNVLISETDKEISSLGLKNSSAVLHPKGTVILSRDAGVGKSAILGDTMAVSQHFMAWRCKPHKLDNYYLYYWLQRDKPRFEGIAAGSTILTIGLQFFREYQIAIPQLVEEQQQISSVLSHADGNIQQFIAGLQKLRSLKAALMQDLLTGKRRVSALLESEPKRERLYA
ncbi:restriction endonuclease subunit S [Bradyrhizobium sp. 1(2017)]|uniref:restriction endonuclease subunit S n=1 Tax=Bradyrhizobium sp. 1(2017) TaxID=1404888 RepID=UPI00140F32A3|nr:restriction endonuclease subunit S [Bradyrhizobium sp. 1(2017)]QIO31339.1 hypothetical protein HAP40_05630 [Bradyrhizobium sp. 1(2017)]